MGALSVVISSLLSHFILDERLSLFGWISCIQCLLGSTILALNGPEEQSVTTIKEFQHLFVTPWFLAYGGSVIVIALFLAIWVAPRYGKRSMLPCKCCPSSTFSYTDDVFVDIGICSLIGGLSVSCTQGLGACILTSIRGENQVCSLPGGFPRAQLTVPLPQFKYWFTYFLMLFVIVTLRTLLSSTQFSIH